MKKIIALAVAFVAIAIVAGPEANAQSFSFNNGFNFGAGVGASRGIHSSRGAGFFNNGFNGGFGTFNRAAVVERSVRPPYFAEFPPVYYNGIVRRPYGISPYAAPAGVVPVELTHGKAGIQPAVVTNPFFKKGRNKAASVFEEKNVEAKPADNKSTQVVNPFIESAPESLGPIRHASFDALLED